MGVVYVVRAEGESDTYLTSEASALAMARDYARKMGRSCWVTELSLATPIG